MQQINGVCVDVTFYAHTMGKPHRLFYFYVSSSLSLTHSVSSLTRYTPVPRVEAESKSLDTKQPVGRQPISPPDGHRRDLHTGVGAHVSNIIR